MNSTTPDAITTAPNAGIHGPTAEAATPGIEPSRLDIGL